MGGSIAARTQQQIADSKNISFGDIIIKAIVMNRNDISNLLTQHRNAYNLLLWLDKKAVHEDKMISPPAIASLKDSELCKAWIQKNRESMPQEFLPDSNQLDIFANVLVSFFRTSFHVKTQEFDGKVLERVCAELRILHKGKNRLPKYG